MAALMRSFALMLSMLAGLFSWPLAADLGPVLPPAAIGGQCVAPADVMRRDHMDLLNHQRDETVIDGIRSNPYSLVDCVNCHASRNASGQAIRIDAKGQFCQACHTYAAVRIDCFSCHAALPEQVVGALQGGLHSGAQSAQRATEIRLLQAYADGR